MAWHRHQWTEVRRVFTPPPERSFKARGLWSDTLEALTFGVTSIELRCECGDITERRLIGDHT